MYDFEELLQEILKSRPELTKEKLLERVEEKKKTVGAGYLTDQGALFLVAGELGVALRQVNFSDLTLGNLFIGANDVTVTARVLAVYPAATYQKKDGGQGKYRKAVLFDKDKATRLTMWEEKTGEMEKEGITVGAPVRIVNAYVKQGLDGKPELNLGRRGRVELADEKAAVELPTLGAVARKLGKLDEEGIIPALDCVVESVPRYSEFVRSDGSPGSLYQFEVSGEEGKAKYRVVVWSPTTRPGLSVGQKIRVTNVRTRSSSRGEAEIHGDAGSTIVVGGSPGPVKQIEVRAAAVNPRTKGSMIACLSEAKRVRFVEAEFEGVDVRPGDVIRVPCEAGDSARIVCKSPDMLTKVDGRSFPRLEDLATKVKDAKDETAQIMLEAIALSHGRADNVQLKDGTVVKKGELVVGDDTGETRLVGWRELAERVSGIQPGERLRVIGVTPKSNRMGAWNLQISSSTIIERLRGP